MNFAFTPSAYYVIAFVQDQLEYDVILTTYNMVISSTEDRILFK
jgi:hypothetical protein